MKPAQYVGGWMGRFGTSDYDRPIPEIDHWLCAAGCACATGIECSEWAVGSSTWLSKRYHVSTLCPVVHALER